MIRVLFWSSGFPPAMGGVETLAEALLPALESQGFEFEVVTSAWGESAHSAGDARPVHRLPLAASLSEVESLARARRRVAEIKARFRPHLVHVFQPTLETLLHLLTEEGCPTMLSLHGRWPEVQGGNTVVRRLLEGARRVTACSAWVREAALELSPTVEPRLEVLPNAIPLRPFSDPAVVPAAQTRLACLGRLSPEKGFDVAVAAAALLGSSFPNLELHLAGEGPQRLELERTAQRLGVRLVLAGRLARHEVPAWLAQARLVLVPSRTEGFGLSALEAALCARPVVASNVGGLPELVRDGQTGLLVPCESPSDLARAAASLLQDEQAAQAMGAAAQRWVAERYSWEAYVAAHQRRYRELARS